MLESLAFASDSQKACSWVQVGKGMLKGTNAIAGQIFQLKKLTECYAFKTSKS